MKDIHEILEGNEVDLIFVPRINTVEGITEQHVRSWGWSINEKGWINYPDWQGRIFRNRPNIRWEKPVHEQLTGFQTYAHLPMEQKYSIVHPKTIERQELQNQKYSINLECNFQWVLFSFPPCRLIRPLYLQLVTSIFLNPRIFAPLVPRIIA